MQFNETTTTTVGRAEYLDCVFLNAISAALSVGHSTIKTKIKTDENKCSSVAKYQNCRRGAMQLLTQT